MSLRSAPGFLDQRLSMFQNAGNGALSTPARLMRYALGSFQNPFFTTRLYHPLGTTLVFHTFDLPSTLLVLPLFSLFNTSLQRVQSLA